GIRGFHVTGVQTCALPIYSRIGKRFLFAGIGYGGSCFPKDVQALAKTARDFDYDFRILNSVMAVNEDQKKRLVPLVMDYFEGDRSEGRRVGTEWGERGWRE